VRTSGEPVELSDGSMWGSKQAYLSTLGMMHAAGVRGIPASKGGKRRALAASRKRSHEDVDPESSGGQEGDAASDDDDRRVRWKADTEEMFKGITAKRTLKKLPRSQH